jgi:hypothetical protein
MSLPTAPIVAVAQSSAPLAPLDVLLATANTNPYLIGTAMLLLNFGGRFLALEMTKGQEQFFQNTWVRRSLIFTVIFVGTRNLLVAFWMSLFIILCVGYLFNENSSLCLFHLGSDGSTCATSPGLLPTPVISNGALTVEEGEILKRLLDKQQKNTVIPDKKEESKPKQSPSDIYWQNMNFLNKEGFANPRF